ncbi:MAG: hypothetical protein HDT46_10815 [Ruminococcaceae bacterium]|nr:hypothetical protein [Oscillospiraceae bacterium]
MNDNEIRKLIDNCTNQIKKTGVDADEVKKLVMAKLGADNKNTVYEDTENDVYIEPQFVSKSKGNNLKFKIAFTAAAAAACVGIAAVGVNFVRGDLSRDLAGAGSGDKLSLTDTAGGEDISLIEQETEHTEAAVQPEDDNILHVTLLNGIEMTYDFNGNCETIEYDITDILALGDNELWFIGNGEKINVTKAAGDKSYYIYTYVNENTKREHKVIVSNTTEPAECGYFELYRIDDIEGFEKNCGWLTDGRNCYINSDMSSPIAEGYKQWVYDALEELGLTAFDGKASERAGNGEIIDMSNAVYITGSPLPIFPISDKDFTLIYKDDIINLTSLDDPLPDYLTLLEEFKLMNGDTIRVAIIDEDRLTRPDSNRYTTLVYRNENRNSLFVMENGRIFFIGNNEHIDITDEAGEDKAYIYSYTNPDRNETHYIAAGGTAENFEYTEIYPVYNEEENEIMWHSCGLDLGSSAVNPLMADAVKRLNIDMFGEFTFDEALDLTVGAENTASYSYQDDLDVEAMARQASIDPLPAGVTLVEEFNLLDNTLVRRAVKDDNQDSHSTYMYSVDITDIFSSENGRLYFIGNGEHEDITDIISEDKAYVYSYIHPDRNKVHYVIAGGGVDDFGYAELFSRTEAQTSWLCHGYNCFVDGNSTQHDPYKPWLSSAINELGIFTSGGGGSEKDFSYLFGSE